MTRTWVAHGVRWLGAAVCAGLLLSCGEPIVSRTPEEVYALAKAQLSNANYVPAVDTLSKVTVESPQSEPGRRAQVLRIAVLSGLARGFKEIGESCLAGRQKAGAAQYASEMRSVAMDYFSRARGHSIEMVEALDYLIRYAPTGPFRVDFPLPEVPGGGSPVLAKVRLGNWVRTEELAQAETDAVRQGLAQSLTRLAGAGEDVNQARARFQGDVELDPAAFYLGVAQEIVDLSSIYGRDALQDPRMFRLFHERAAAAAERAAKLAGEKGDRKLQAESEHLQRRCQDVLRKP